MKKILAFIAIVVALTACDAGIPTPQDGVGRDGWWEVNDPATDRTFRCLWWSLTESTAMWCYEVER